MRTARVVANVALGLLLLQGCDPDDDGGVEVEDGMENEKSPHFEVWLVDQSNSPDATFGGTLYVFDEKDVKGKAKKADPEVISLAGAATELCFAQTGSVPVRPHMIVFNSTHSHGILSFVVSGHVVLLDGPTREPVACFRTEPGVAGARQAHAAFPTPDDQYVVVANQNGKKLERIKTNYLTGTFEQEPEATIDLAGCTTPNGVACEAVGIRPDNAPICPVPLPNGQVVVTLRGGGMFVVDPYTTPMSIVGEYDMGYIVGNGCGGTIVQDTLFLTSGGGTPSNLYAYEVYALPTSGYEATNPVNTPIPISVDSDDSVGRDAHGVTPARVSLGAAEAKYLWVADRGYGIISTYDALSYDLLDEIQLSNSQTITPDLLDTNPVGNLVFASLRGPMPLSGDPHVSVGDVPGLAVFKVTANGKSGKLDAIVPITNLNAAGQETADAHGIQVRRK